MAYQLAFDVAEADNQAFILNVLASLRLSDVPQDDALDARLTNLERILKASGFTIDLQLNFLNKQSKADSLLLLAVKDSLEARNGTLHQATVAAHGFMFAGTANTSFVREQMDWFKKSSNWAKFSATASIGVIHRPKGTLEASKAELAAYLPSPAGSVSPYSEGGALYALGLIHAAKGVGEGLVPYLLETLDAAGPNEPIQHGGYLALGLAAMGTADQTLFERLKDVVLADSDIAGEAAAYGIGLLLLGRLKVGLSNAPSRKLFSRSFLCLHRKNGRVKLLPSSSLTCMRPSMKKSFGLSPWLSLWLLMALRKALTRSLRLFSVTVTI